MLDEKQVKFLFDYWVANTENICRYCIHYKPCKKEECESFEDYGEQEGFFGKIHFTCMDCDFGECPLLENTPCNGCVVEEDFVWNGEIGE